MKVKQFIGPFPQNQILDLSDISNRKLTQIGIECPHSIPISETGTQEIVLRINNQSFAIGETDILNIAPENIYAREISIIVQQTSSPYLIIDIAYE